MTPLGVEYSPYYGGELNGVIHRLVWHADSAIGGLSKAKAINIIQRLAKKASITKIKGLADTHAEEKEGRNAKKIEIDIG
jgi:hypothetical protein